MRSICVPFVSRARTGAFSVALLAMVAEPAGALPGQTVASFLTSARGGVFDSMSAQSHRQDRGEVDGTGTDRGVFWRLHVYAPAGPAIDQEYLELSVSDRPIPVRHDGRGPGFAFLTRAYGERLADDYRRSVPLTQFSAEAGTTLFRGRRFGYVTRSAGGGDNFTVTSLAGLARLGKDIVKCAHHSPDRDQECITNPSYQG